MPKQPAKVARVGNPRVCQFCKRELGEKHGHHHLLEWETAICCCRGCPTPEAEKAFRFKYTGPGVIPLMRQVLEELEEEAVEAN